MGTTRSVALTAVLCFFYSVAAAQTNPGGVGGAVHWYAADTAGNKGGLRSRIPSDTTFLTFEHATLQQLNYHPALKLDGRSSLLLPLAPRDWRSASIFTVYQAIDTAHENSIWYTTQNTTTGLVLTTDRMADLPAYRYMNYNDVARHQPKVNVYVQQKEKDTPVATLQSLHIGGQPVTPKVPVVNFNGLIPELIIYNRVLNSTERLQVASWLALKYGITLTEPGATYLNSAGQPIWKGYDYPDWHNNIAGIGRDDTAGFNQSQATSSNTPGLLTITTADALSNNTFLLWGDNDKPLIPAPRTPGQPVMLQRSWLMKTAGGPAYTTTLQIDTKQIDARLPVQPFYWLVIDPSGEGKFNTQEAVYIPMTTLDKKGIATFTNVAWDEDASGKDVWALIAGPELLLQTNIGQPTCAQQSAGSLRTRILGGKAPFQLVVQNSRGIVDSRRITNTNTPIAFESLTTGKYTITVTDASRHTYTDSFYINHTGVPLPALKADQYTLPVAGTLTLDAGVGLPSSLSWEWKGPDGFQSLSSQVRITKPGVYTIRCGTAGCYNQQDITVKAMPNNTLYDINIFPNPSTGRFAARVTLDEPAPVTMAIYSPEGKLITIQKGERRSNYHFTGELKIAGIYELVFTSGLSKTSRRLMIIK
ncbi:MAG: T9SS type A sorting domain-containing protein [Niastella sp.]|nr:T9SS type A sorting domain-containing protein [Niastella sp.]